ncbi:hypothetical protein NL676_016697 [Syzygium grande]|nr:hypothetical protein NL676_016697 [Syzygium grande]
MSELPLMARVATSSARAAISAVEKLPSQISARAGPVDSDIAGYGRLGNNPDSQGRKLALEDFGFEFGGATIDYLITYPNRVFLSLVD